MILKIVIYVGIIPIDMLNLFLVLSFEKTDWRTHTRGDSVGLSSDL